MRYPRKKAGEKHRRYGTKRRPFQLEVLEDRRMLATFMVTNLMDSGPGSLRDAIAQANQDVAADTIEFDTSLAGGTIALAGGQLEITQSLTINGLGADQLTIDANDTSRVFRADDNNGANFLDVHLDGLTITGGLAYGGAGISSRENLTLTNSVVTQNRTVDDFAGGAGIFHAFGQLTINDSIVSNNMTLGEFARGGGIYLLTDTAVITDTTISGNHTAGTSAKGGGIYNADSDLTLLRSAIVGNTAAAANGGGICQVAGTTTISDSTISANSTSRAGGGIAMAADGDLSVLDSVVSDNYSDSDGGGIRVISGSTHVLRTTVLGNTASKGGGLSASSGTVTVDESEFLNNSASFGGGIHVSQASVSLSLTTVSDNISASGGGLRAVGTNSTVSIDRSMISNNSASVHGGGIVISLAKLHVDNSVIAGNGAFQKGGGIYSAGQVPAETTISNSTISGNRAFTREGGGIVNVGSYLTISNSTITDNTAPAGKGSGVHSGGNRAFADVHSSIIAGNTNSDFDRSASGTIRSGGFNIIGDGNAASEFSFFDITGISDPGLAPLAANGGPTLTHALLPGSVAIDNGANVKNLRFDQRGSPFDRNANGTPDVGALELQEHLVDGDFDDDGDYGCADVDALIAQIAAGTNNPLFDLTGDSLVNNEDLDAWLAEAGAAELPSGNPYSMGDATLDGVVDGVDFIVWNTNKFTSLAAWCAGDFNADGVVDGQDFIIWNENKFQSSDRATGIILPERLNSSHWVDESRDTRLDNSTEMTATSHVSPFTSLTARRVDLVFATSRRGVDHEVDRPKAYSFENFGNAIPIYPCVL